ncbi:MAG: DUF2953 domain-containing protein [Oscillospiraceae bacterium]|nr:DUF2953 domain-containing protein [Oscillospiraceae bacterium]
MGWLIFLAILIGLGCLPLGVRLRYDEDGPLAAVLLGRLPIVLYPVPGWLKKLTSREKKTGENKPKEEKPKKEKPQKAAENPQGGSWKKFLPLVQLGLHFLGDFRRKLRVNRLVLRLTLAGDDPCDLAVNYGRAWAAVGNLLAALKRAFVIQKRDVEVQCDFLGEETKVVFAMDLTITLGRVLGLLVKYGIRAVKILLKMKNQKAVQNNE